MKIVWIGVAVLVFMLGLWWAYAIHDRTIAENALLRAQLVRRDTVIRQVERSVVRVDTLWRTRLQAYQVTRDSILHDTTRVVIPRIEVIHMAAACDSLLNGCSHRVAVRDTLVELLRLQVKDLTTVKAMPTPRLHLGATALYTFDTQTPTAALLASVRIAGPITAVVGGRLAVPPQAGVRAGLLAGLLYSFR